MRRFFPLIALVAAVVGVSSLFLPWFESHTGVDLILGNVLGLSDDIQRYLIMVFIILTIIGGLLAVRELLDQRRGLTSYGWLLFGFIILALTVVIGMWSPDGQKINTMGDMGLYFSYVSASVFIVYGIIRYSVRFR